METKSLLRGYTSSNGCSGRVDSDCLECGRISCFVCELEAYSCFHFDSVYGTHDGIFDTHVEFKNVDEIQGFKSSSFDQLFTLGAKDYRSHRCNLVYLECAHDVILCGKSGVRHFHSVFLCDLQNCGEKVELEEKNMK